MSRSATNGRYSHAKRGLAYWLEAAPTEDYAEILNAREEYDSPEEAWPDKLGSNGGENR